MRLPRIQGARALRMGFVVAATIATPLAVAMGNVAYKLGRLEPELSLSVDRKDPVDLPEHDFSKPTAVVLFSQRATEVTDALPPFGIIAETGAFNTYAMAPVRRPVSLYNAGQRPAGVHVLPHLGFEEYDGVVGRDPDLVVVPYFPGWAPGTDDETVEWIRDRVGPRTRVVTACAGTEIFAATGLLDYHAATTNPYWMERLVERHPTVRWLPDHRYVADGRFFTSTSLASGIDATLAAIADLLGRDEARRVAERLAYRHVRYLDDPRAPFPKLSLSPFPDMAFARGGTVPVVVDAGVDEIGLSAVLEIEAAPIRSTRVVSVEGTGVRTRRGLELVVASSIEEVGSLHRAIWVAGAEDEAPPRVVEWATERGGKLAAPLRGDLFPYDAVIADVGLRGGERLARGAAANLAYPVSRVAPTSTRWPSGWWWTLAWALVGAAGASWLLAYRSRRWTAMRASPSSSLFRAPGSWDVR